MLALSAACAPDAALGSMPLVYPFVVNDPGEGAQAKRRAHAVIIDHLVPPMMRAESYDELADLEALMDEYARLEILDPSKLPGLGAQIWSAIEQANLQEDLGIDGQPGDAGQLVEHLDGYLCEVKDVQIKDGLHVLGVVPEGARLRGLVAAIGRHGSGTVPGLRRAIAAAFGLDEPALVAAPGVKVDAERSAALLERFPGTAYRGSDLLDRFEEAQHALLSDFSEQHWDPDRAATVCRSVLGHEDAGVIAALRFAGGQIVPRLLQTTDEMTNLLGALRGRHVPAGPSGAPTRGRLDVLPTGRNFYSVDPRALPSELSYATGVKLADARPRAPPGRHRGASGDGGARGLGHRGDAHPGRRRRRDARAARRPPHLARGVAAGHRPRGRPGGRARAAADRRDAAHLGVLPRRVPAPDRSARRRGDAGRRARRAR